MDKLATAHEENNTKPFWSYIKQLKRDYIGVASIKSGGRLETDPEQKANLLNTQFKSVFVQKDQEGQVPSLDGAQFDSINSLTITTKGVEKLLSNLVTHKESGLDQIPNTLLKIHLSN